MVGQSFVLISADINKDGSDRQPCPPPRALWQTWFGLRERNQSEGVYVSVPVIHVFITRSKHKGERLANSVARSHLATLKPKAMRWTYSSSPTSQGSAVAGRSTTPQRVRCSSPETTTAYVQHLLTPTHLTPFSNRNTVPAACATGSVYCHQRPAACVSVSGLFHRHLQDWL